MTSATSQLDAIEAKLFRQLLGCFPTGVAVITTRAADGRPAGLTCNSFSSVSLEPPLVLFSLRKASSLLGTFAEADGFAINILSERQDALSGRFASSKIADKFEGVAWRPGPLGMPIIEDCLASFECSVHARHEAGDHDIFIGEVKHMGGGAADQALVFYKGAYMMLAESLRTLVIQGRLGSADLDEAYRTLYGTLLRLACERATDGEIDAIEAAVDGIERHQADGLARAAHRVGQPLLLRHRGSRAQRSPHADGADDDHHPARAHDARGPGATAARPVSASAQGRAVPSAARRRRGRSRAGRADHAAAHRRRRRRAKP